MKDILELLPHRYPFLLVDKILEVDPGKSAVGLKNVSYNEPYFQGHFPKNKIMPGALIIESLAQMCAIMYGYDCDENASDKVGYLAMVKKMKFLKTVVPGDALILKVKLDTEINNLLYVKVKAIVNDEEAASGILVVSKND